jgi:hypothetical protein
MKTLVLMCMWAVVSGLFGVPGTAATVDGSFTYQGSLLAGSTAVTGTFDFQFNLCTALTGPTTNAVVTSLNIPVTNGNFTTALNFGSVFDGTAYWIELAVRTNGNAGPFTALSPRQPLLATPYAQYALHAAPSGTGQTLAGVGATVGGGENNQSTADDATVGGGIANVSGARFATVGGGSQNWSIGEYSTVSGGSGNRVLTNVSYGTIAGGSGNKVLQLYATVSGGDRNCASGGFSVVGGGMLNTNSGLGATIPGGVRNLASGDYSLAAGRRAKAVHPGSFVWGDSTDADFASTAADQFLIRAAGGVGIGTASPLPGAALHIAGGAAIFDRPGGAIRVTKIAGQLNIDDLGIWNRGGPGSQPFAIADWNTGTKGVFIDTSSGNVGIGAVTPTTALDVNGVVRASSFVGSTANITGSAGGGVGSDGKLLNVNNSSGNSFAYGITAIGNTSIKATSASGNIALLGTPLYAGDFTGAAGNRARLGTPSYAGYFDGIVSATSYETISDRNVKTNFAPVDAHEVLRRIIGLRLQHWSFTNAPGVRHIGPMAQDFYAAFAVGADNKHIATVDADGVALAAIQGLNEIIQEKESEIAELGKQLSTIRKETLIREEANSTLERRVAALEKAATRLMDKNEGSHIETRANTRLGQ